MQEIQMIDSRIMWKSVIPYLLLLIIFNTRRAAVLLHSITYLRKNKQKKEKISFFLSFMT